MFDFRTPPQAGERPLFGESSSSRKSSRAPKGPGLRKLFQLHHAAALQDLSLLSANRLEKLTTSRQGQYSIRVNDQYRVCFEWRNGDAFNVEILDYH